MSNFIGSYPNVATKAFCDEYIAKFKELERNSSTFAKQNNNTLGRKDMTIFFDRLVPEEAAKIVSVLDIGMCMYAEEHPAISMRKLISNVVKVQETKPKGGYHNWHCEDHNGSSAGRDLAWILYLNDLPKGEGETEFLEQGIRVQPEAGKLVIFPSAWTHTHRGNPPHSTSKFIATGWYHLTE